MTAERKNLSSGPPAWAKVLIWILAVFLMGTAVVYQRLTGPTHPKRGTFEHDGRVYEYRLVRSSVTTAGARVVVPDPGGESTAFVSWRRYPTNDPYSERAMRSEDGVFVAELPVQPAAGKIEYSVTIDLGERRHHLPPVEDQETVVLRYKDPVPTSVLAPHVILMFFAVLFGIRSGLTALVCSVGMRWSSWVTLTGMTVGGMILGPIVQKHAFGAYWTGWPFGGDLTDNKVLIMWIVWILACTTIGFKPLRKEWVARALVVFAAIVMSIVYMIPHSMRGSELDYAAVDAGVDAVDAIGTSDE